MNILWLSHLVPYPAKGGVLPRSFNLIRELAKYHTLHLLAFNQPAILPKKSDVECALERLREFCLTAEAVSIPCEERVHGRLYLYIKSLWTKYLFAVNWLLSSAMRDPIKAMLTRWRIDLVHFDTVGLAPYLSQCAWVPCALNHHNIESTMMLRRAM